MSQVKNLGYAIISWQF